MIWYIFIITCLNFTLVNQYVHHRAQADVLNQISVDLLALFEGAWVIFSA